MENIMTILSMKALQLREVKQLKEMGLQVRPHSNHTMVFFSTLGFLILCSMKILGLEMLSVL